MNEDSFASLCNRVKKTKLDYCKQSIISSTKDEVTYLQVCSLLKLIDDSTVRLKTLTLLLRRMYACNCIEAQAIIKSVKYNTDRIDALKLLVCYLSDPGNYDNLLPAFPFKEEKTQAGRILTQVAARGNAPMHGSIVTGSTIPFRSQSAASLRSTSSLSYTSQNAVERKVDRFFHALADMYDRRIEGKGVKVEPFMDDDEEMILSEDSSDIPLQSFASLSMRQSSLKNVTHCKTSSGNDRDINNQNTESSTEQPSQHPVPECQGVPNLGFDCDENKDLVVEDLQGESFNSTVLQIQQVDDTNA
ncbi:uncharacterized protein LOC102808363 [Saccoglossus kowalevskii]|uniref:Uncharacterized protein LOC102808363 n=1 Tax=Saccoglossus kowalevskii TaxID=10224 RepID=A0ABM0LVU8_SACKO|nr:PREDICTED: uncharacterized protein LOC102808363 [Saccoglossus kowalevskii]